MQTKLGVIEGFYGKLYQESSRNELISLLENKYSYYIYAPKNDSSLRVNWKSPFTDDKLSFFKRLQSYCLAHNFEFGIGISPLSITQNLDENYQILEQKVVELVKECKVSIIAILFDDIKLYTQDEGNYQKQIVNRLYQRVQKLDSKIRLIFCPTYYSFDPILDKIFGAKPQDYFSQIVDGLHENIEIFWTGNKVLSKSIEKADIENINQKLKRKVTLWDNYPVNDGKNLWQKLFTKPFVSRTNLKDVVKSHAVNPMCECVLSSVAMESLYQIYQGASQATLKSTRKNMLKQLLGEDEKLLLLLDLLNDEGKEKLQATDKEYLLKLLSGVKSKAASELIEYLNDYYKFDPQCLTS